MEILVGIVILCPLVLAALLFIVLYLSIKGETLKEKELIDYYNKHGYITEEMRDNHLKGE